MAIDLDHTLGNDLTILSNGQLFLASGAILGQQSVIRRLLTSTYANPWALDYGADLVRFIGKPMNQEQIQATIRSQMLKEQAVKQLPPPQIDVSASTNNVVVANIRYTDAVEGTRSLIAFDTDGIF